MVFINVSVRRGSRELFPYRLLDFSPALTLRDVTEHTLREDASLMVAVEARERIESGTSTTLTGDSLAATVADIKAMGLNCVSLWSEPTLAAYPNQPSLSPGCCCVSIAVAAKM